MMKVLKWAAIVFVGLAILGALIGDEDNDKGKGKAAAEAVAQAPEEVAEEATPTPTPEPTVTVNVTGPFETTQDSVTLRGTVSDRKAGVRVQGATDVRRKGKRWAADVKIRGVGDNRYRVVAKLAGAKPDRMTATVTRKRTQAEKDALAAERRPALEQENARVSAESYLDSQGFSRSGLIEQLEFEGYSTEAATAAVDAIGVNWNKQAARSAKSYMDSQSFSQSGLIEQLEFEGYTYEQAAYGASRVGY
jgi:Host cell surface-exposed lipoprotein